MPFIFLAIIGSYLIGNVYVFIRGVQATVAFPLWLKIGLACLFWGSAVSFFALMLLRSVKLPLFLSHLFHEIGTGWMVFALYMVLFLLVADLCHLFFRPCPHRFFYVLLFTSGLLVYGFYNYKHPKRVVIDLSLEKPLGETWNTLKVVAVSDVHLGYGTNREALNRYVDMINAEKPDLILIGGDLIDNSVVPLYAERMQDELARLHAPMGIYTIMGNHEYIAGMEHSIRFISETPIRLLRDTAVVLPCGIQLVGRDDRSNRARKSLAALVADIDDTVPTILLDHQPYELAEAQKEGIDLQFSGHTHRGQIWPVSLITDFMFKQSHGFRAWGKSKVYVSSGLSLWGPPFRIGTKSELVVFNLKSVR